MEKFQERTFVLLSYIEGFSIIHSTLNVHSGLLGLTIETKKCSYWSNNWNILVMEYLSDGDVSFQGSPVLSSKYPSKDRDPSFSGLGIGLVLGESISVFVFKCHPGWCLSWVILKEIEVVNFLKLINQRLTADHLPEYAEHKALITSILEVLELIYTLQ